ncbi:receptor-like protein kinase HERK 1 [Panicum miliaceum]|uniref:Receptor-like protein kinase HERK 1 n=1 Tax=Panicum miliaceum TaxID=4540 RepID=A0A3L6SV50_PANMI|nr:receptor-like protein kinase HERK 1 [Panicum miliaceum]
MLLERPSEELMVLPRSFSRRVPGMLLRAVVVLSALLAAARAAFVPADSYLVLCGKAASATVGGRTFVGDSTLPGSVLSAPQSAVANASAGAANASHGEAELYRYARVFPAPSTYTFAIKRPGRHFVRLHFFPCGGHAVEDLASRRDLPGRLHRRGAHGRGPQDGPAHGGLRHPGGGAGHGVRDGEGAQQDSDGTISAQFNMTWRFPATPGWAYLLRLHFCDIVSKAANQLAFNVYVGG